MTIEDVKQKIAEFVTRGAIQLSRKYRMIGVPPQLEEGKSFLDLLRERNPLLWKRYEAEAREEITRSDRATHVELTAPEFNEWLLQTGRSVRPEGRGS